MGKGTRRVGEGEMEAEGGEDKGWAREGTREEEQRKPNGSEKEKKPFSFQGPKSPPTGEQPVK